MRLWRTMLAPLNTPLATRLRARPLHVARAAAAAPPPPSSASPPPAAAKAAVSKTAFSEALFESLKDAHPELTKASVAKVLNGALDSIISHVAQGDKVTFIGFGSFSRAERQARTGRNPRTGDALEIPASKVAKFTVGSGFKESVSAGPDHPAH